MGEGPSFLLYKCIHEYVYAFVFIRVYEYACMSMCLWIIHVHEYEHRHVWVFELKLEYVWVIGSLHFPCIPSPSSSINSFQHSRNNSNSKSSNNSCGWHSWIFNVTDATLLPWPIYRLIGKRTFQTSYVQAFFLWTDYFFLSSTLTVYSTDWALNLSRMYIIGKA